MGQLRPVSCAGEGEIASDSSPASRDGRDFHFPVPTYSVLIASVARAGNPICEIEATSMTYIRETDGAVMVEVAPHVFVNEESAKALGLLR